MKRLVVLFLPACESMGAPLSLDTALAVGSTHKEPHRPVFDILPALPGTNQCPKGARRQIFDMPLTLLLPSSSADVEGALFRSSLLPLGAAGAAADEALAATGVTVSLFRHALEHGTPLATPSQAARSLQVSRVQCAGMPNAICYSKNTKNKNCGLY